MLDGSCMQASKITVTSECSGNLACMLDLFNSLFFRPQSACMSIVRGVMYSIAHGCCNCMSRCVHMYMYMAPGHASY